MTVKINVKIKKKNHAPLNIQDGQDGHLKKTKKQKLIYVWNILCIPSHIWVLIFHFKKSSFNLSYNFAVLDIRISF